MDDQQAPGLGDGAAVRASLPAALAGVLEESDDGPFESNTALLRTLEALVTLQVVLFKLSSECSQRVLSHSSRDFADGQASTVQRALQTMPTVQEWVARLDGRLRRRSPLPLADTERQCSV